MNYAELSEDVKAEIDACCTISWDDYVELCWQAEQQEQEQLH